MVALGELIENWHVSDFHISKARPEPEFAHAEHLSTEGDNLALVIQYLYQKHRPIFDKVLKKLERRIPGLSNVEAKTTEEGRVLLRFQDGSFKDPFLARHVSDGTIKMLAYLVLLHDPDPHPLLCVEEPENQLYPSLLAELAEEFREYANRGGQVFVSTHSPDFLNYTRLEEVFCLEELSAKTLLESLVPRVIQDFAFETQFIVFECKSDLDKKLERRLRGWLRPKSLFIVLRDQDSGDCHEIKHTHCLYSKMRRR